MNYLLYQAYGSTEILYEALYSILSYLRVSKDTSEEDRARIIIYTDNEQLFRKYLHGSTSKIEYVAIDQEKIQEWRGEINFVHRVKIKMLQDFFSRELGNVLYVDTDTVFLKKAAPMFGKIGRGELFMHTCEGQISSRQNRIFEKVYKHLEANGFAVKVNGRKLEVPAQTEMWNAGVLGINDRHKLLLQRVLDFTDSVYKELPMHIIEQFGFSFFFTQNRKVLAAEDAIYHYWNFKEFRQVLTQFFTKNEGKTAPELIALLDKINPQELIKPKLEYENLRGLKRVLRKLSGKKWELGSYEG